MQSASKSQRLAICHRSGPMLVMAGPGSGKTFVMIERLRYLLYSSHADPGGILLISFSKAAAIQLKERFHKKNQYRMEEVTFATFHAFFFQILKEVYHYTSKDIIQSKEKKEILITILLDPRFKLEEVDQEIAPSRLQEKAEELIRRISYYKNRGRKEMEEKENPFFISVYDEYNKIIHGSHKLDFDDMGLLCFQLLKQENDILKKWQKRYPHIMIDEFQDINEIQFQVIRLLTKENRNLFVVGDDDQAIYSFRGSSPKFMLEFEKYYPDTKKVLLETNYRCDRSIVEKSLQLITTNRCRLEKDIKAFHSTGKEEVEIKAFSSAYEEYRYLTEKIQELFYQGVKPEEICCIFRTNAGMIPLTQVFTQNKIPVSLKESCTGIFQHFVAKDIYHYLRFFYEGHKRKDFIAIMNKPLRYLSRSACMKEIISWEDLLNYYPEKGYMKGIIEDLKNLERMILKLDFYGAIYYLRKVGGYESYLKEYCKKQQLCWQEVKDVLEFIHNSFRGISQLEVWEKQVKEYENILKKSLGFQGGVALLTMHGCKGLEYQYVFLPDCNEGKIPHTKAVTEEDLEEEKRMFYVAMTRAIRHLEIFYLEDKEEGYIQKSRFIENLL